MVVQFVSCVPNSQGVAREHYRNNPARQRLAAGLCQLPLLACCVLMIATSLQAEEVPAGTMTPSRDRLEAQLNGLATKRMQLSKEIRDARQELPGADAVDHNYPRLLELIQNQLQELEASRADRSSELEKQVKSLETILKRSLVNESVDAGNSKTTDQPVPAEPQQGSATEPSNLEGPSKHQSATEPIPTEITKQAVDRAALANNLFGAGESQLALEIYEKLEATTLQRQDQLWVQYQIANCQRRLEKTTEAERYYRVIAEATDSGFLANYARWWLDAIEKRQNLLQGLQQIQQSLEVLESELNGPGS